MNSPIVACYDTILALARIVPAGMDIEINNDSQSVVDCMLSDILEGTSPEVTFDLRRWNKRADFIKALKGE